MRAALQLTIQNYDPPITRLYIVGYFTVTPVAYFDQSIVAFHGKK